MKKLLVLGALFSVLSAHADIPNIPDPSPTPSGDAGEATVAQVVVQGSAAKELAAQLKEVWQMEAPLATSTTRVKVWFASDSLAQIVCHETAFRMPASRPAEHKCTVQTSTNGKKLSKYIVRIKMG